MYKKNLKSICKYLERASHGHLSRIRGEPRGGLDRVQARTVSNPKPSGKFGKKQTSPRHPTWSTTWWQKRMMTEQERNFARKAWWTNFGNWRFRLEVSLRVRVTSWPAGQTGLSLGLNGGEPYKSVTRLIDFFLRSRWLPITKPRL